MLCQEHYDHSPWRKREYSGTSLREGQAARRQLGASEPILLSFSSNLPGAKLTPAAPAEPWGRASGQGLVSKALSSLHYFLSHPLPQQNEGLGDWQIDRQAGVQTKGPGVQEAGREEKWKTQ